MITHGATQYTAKLASLASVNPASEAIKTHTCDEKSLRLTWPG